MVIKKNTKDTIWDKKWQGKVKWLSKSLEDSRKQKLEKLIDEGVACKTETDTLKADYDSKNREYTDAKQARLTHVGGARNEKARLNGGAVNHEDGAVDNKSTWTASMTSFQTTWQTSGWENVNQAHYPADYLDNLYEVKDQAFKITEDETVKLLSRVIYEIGKLDKADYVKWHGITDATKKAEAETIFDSIKLCSQAIEQMNSKGASANDLTKKTWDLPFTYSEEQKILATGKNAKAVNARWNLLIANQPTFLSNVFKFVKEYLTADCIGKLDQKTVNITETEDWKISKSGEVYTEEELKDYGITLTDPKKTFLYRTNPKEVHEFKVEGGLNGWISLFNSVLEKKENQDKLVASYTNSPTQILFNDLRTQDGIDTAFAGNRLPETETAMDELIDDLKLKKSANEKKCNELEDGVKKAKKSYTDKNYEYSQKILRSDILIKELLTAKKKEFTDFHIEKGFEDKTSTGGEDNRRSFEDLFKIKQTILEVRYLEHNGDATLTSSLTIPAPFTEENALITKLEELMSDRYGIEKYQLCNYFKGLIEVGTGGIDKAITKIENSVGITGYLGLKPKERFQAFIDSFKEMEKIGGLSPEEKASLDKLIEKVGGTPTETPQQWTDKLKAIDGLTSFVVNDTLKTQWTSLPNSKFDKIDKVESLVKETLGSDNKVDPKFIEQATAKKASLTSLAEVMKQNPKEVIILVERYKFDKLDDSATNEKDKKKTQQIRRIKKALKDKDSNFDITKDLDDATLNDALYKVKVNELVVNANKYYTADLKEITGSPKEEQPSFLRWSNPWVYAIGVSFAGIVAVIIYWDKIVTWFNQGADDQGKDEDNDEDND